MIGKTNSDTVFGYKYLAIGDRRQQQAWFKWKLNNPLLYHFIINDEYFFLDTDNFLQSLKIVQSDDDPIITQDDVNYQIHLDNHTTVSNGVYNASTNLTTLYTVPAQTTAIIKSVRVANVDTSNNCEVSLYLVDTGTTSYTLQLSRDIESKTTQELLAAGNSSQVSADSSTSSIAPLVAKESEIIKIQAENANDLHVVLSVLEIS